MKNEMGKIEIEPIPPVFTKIEVLFSIL